MNFKCTVFVLCCLVSLTQAKAPWQDKFERAMGKFLDILFEDVKPGLNDEIFRLAALVETMNATLAQTQQKLTKQILDEIEEVKENVNDMQKCTCSKRFWVFHVAVGRYTLNFEQAKQKCIDNGAKIAAPNQLQAAQARGYDQCQAGWLSDGSVRYPITMPRWGCGEGSPGVRSWGKPAKTKTYDVYCFKKPNTQSHNAFERAIDDKDTGGTCFVDRLLEKLSEALAEQQQQQTKQILDKIEEVEEKVDDIRKCTCSERYGVFHLAVGRYTLNFEQAKQICIDNGAVIATVEQLKAAQSFGFDQCSAGWLSDGSVRYPITMPRPGCGGDGPPGIKSWGNPAKTNTYDVYCFKKEKQQQ
ncbi:brevican core protein-like [Antedon mediterranea]|uniref:brevican core protein-like n=1 Tax=Antedon mediterranea TaxID=105859 RepID=UPI003AF6222B